MPALKIQNFDTERIAMAVAPVVWIHFHIYYLTVTNMTRTCCLASPVPENEKLNGEDIMTNHSSISG